MPFTAWKHTERKKDRNRKKIFMYYDFMRFCDSSTVCNLLKQYITFISTYLDIYYLKDPNQYLARGHTVLESQNLMKS